MSSMELNKIAGAVLLAGVIGALSGFAAEILVHPHDLSTPVYLAGGEVKGPATAAAPAGPADILPLLTKADPAAGKTATKPCLACHTFEQGGANKVGPNLYGVVGAAKAQVPGFSYSDGLKALPGPWRDSELNQFLFAPKSYVAGTKMSFAGLKNDQERANLIAYLRSISPAAPAPQ